RATASRPMKKNVDGQMQAGVILQSHVGSRGIRNSLCESYVAHPKELSDVTTFIVDAPAYLVSCYSGTYILGVYARSDSPMIFGQDVENLMTWSVGDTSSTTRFCVHRLARIRFLWASSSSFSDDALSGGFHIIYSHLNGLQKTCSILCH
ncbi:hypothetical protein F444_13566, partial [Phytophthora nicotianae P1976]